MKYVIKGRWTSWDAYVENMTPAFSYTSDLELAHKFWTLGDAIDAIVARQINIDIKQDYQSQDKFNIIGVKEVNQPRYEEVLL